MSGTFRGPRRRPPSSGEDTDDADRSARESRRTAENDARGEAAERAASARAAENETRRQASDAEGRRQADENEARRQASDAEARRQGAENEVRYRSGGGAPDDGRDD